jgi:hypothetical protein
MPEQKTSRLLRAAVLFRWVRMLPEFLEPVRATLL